MNSTRFEVDNLEWSTSYQFQVAFCNRKGCTYSATSRESTSCRTKDVTDTLPRLEAPTCSEELFSNNNNKNNNSSTISTTDENRLALTIDWSTASQHEQQQQQQQADFVYTLYRSTIRSPAIAFDRDYSPLVDEDEEKRIARAIYSGSATHFVDTAVNFFTTYEYFVSLLVSSSKGNRLLPPIKSPCKQCTTSAHAPQLLVDAGTCLAIGNDSLLLDLKPPRRLNGHLVSASLFLVKETAEKPLLVRRVELYSSNETATLTANDLLCVLRNVSLTDLEAATSYAISTQFCNQLACLNSTRAVRVTTFENVRIAFFRADSVSSSRVNLSWRLTTANSSQSQKTGQNIK